MRTRRYLAVCLLLVSAAGRDAAGQAVSPVLQAMQSELDRPMQKLKTQPVPPYFLSYEIVDTHSYAVTASFGKLNQSSEGHHRQLDIDLRVGDYTLDNTREVREGLPFGPFGGFSSAQIPIENDPDAIRAVLWYRTDDRYKRAVEQLTKVKTNVQVAVAAEDKSDDFSHEQSQHFSEPQVDVKVDRKLWEEKLRKYTAPFAKYTNIYGAEAADRAASVL